MEFNKFLSSLDDLRLDSYPLEILDEFLDFLNTVPYIKALVSENRPYAKDCPRDLDGKIIVDLTNPPIIEDTDYFRPTAIYFLKNGCITHLRPNPNPNSEYGKWVREETRRCFYGYIRESDGAWITGDMYFFLNYCPIIKVKRVKGKKGIRVVDFPDFQEGQWLKFMYILMARDNAKHGSELASRGKGKAHPYSEKVLTPTGWTTWENINEESSLYAIDGTETKVSYIPYDLVSDIYEVKLIDGRSFRCTSEHLIPVYNHKTKKYEVKSLIDILKDYIITRKVTNKITAGREYNYRIPKCNCINFQSQNVLIDPYTLGIVLGDGCLRSNNVNNVGFTSCLSDIQTYIDNVPYNIHKVTRDKYSYNIELLTSLFGDLWGKKSEDKYIPKEYLYNSKECRLSILLGLMDTDGTVTFGTPIFTTTSELLKNDVEFLVRSLGYNCSTSTKIPKYKGKEYHRCWDIRIYTNDPIFRLQRKLNKVYFNNESKVNNTSIIDIKYIGLEKAKCVAVDNITDCYIIDDFIPTHNSYTMAAIAAKRFILGELDETTGEVTKKVETFISSYLKNYLNEDGVLNKFESYIDFCEEYTQFPRKRLLSSINNMHWLMGYKLNGVEAKKGSLNEVIGISVKDSAGKLRGKRGAFIGLEEMGSFPNLIELYGTLRPSMEDGDIVFGMIYAQGCVQAGTKVLLPNGQPINIEDVQLNQKLLGYDCDKASEENISWLLPYGLKHCLKITTEKNNFIECSIDHPLLAINKNKYNRHLGTCSFYRANELKVGDTLLMPRRVGNFGTIHEDNAYLLGSLFGDGNYSDNSCVTLSITTEEEYEYWNNKYDINISKLKDNYALIYFRKLHPLLLKYNMDKLSFENKKLPYNIFDWDKESLCNFLGGYFNADGNILIIKKKHRSIKLTCKYKDTLVSIKYLLLKLGITAHIYKEHKKSRILKSNVNERNYNMSETDVYVLYISNSSDIMIFKNNIRFIIKTKQDRLDSYNLVCKHGIIDKIKFKLRANKKGLNFVDKYFYNLQLVTIKSIEDNGIQRIYNMTADTTHTYISNGFISSNTAGDKDSDFSAAQQIMYSPRAFNMLPIRNVYDKVGLGKLEFVYFYPAYMNRNGCQNKDGISDVTKAMLEILINRYNVKYNSNNSNLITKTIAEHPIVPQEAVLRTRGNMFPVTLLNERINQLDNNPNIYDDILVGTLVQGNDGEVRFKPTNDLPIRVWPTDDNKEKGAIEIFSLPEKNREGKVYSDRYIIGHDPVDDDVSLTMSLTSTFVLDLLTDLIVAEYTGRQDYADLNFEIVRKLCLFYNAKCLYESNKKGIFAYFNRMNCLYLLADTPQYLKDLQIIKEIGYGNKSKGVNASANVNAFADRLTREWLIKPVEYNTEENGEITLPNLMFIRNKAFLLELVSYNPLANFDRIRAFGMLMLYRLEKIILYLGDMNKTIDDTFDSTYAGNDEFFTTNYDERFE